MGGASRGHRSTIHGVGCGHAAGVPPCRGRDGREPDIGSDGGVWDGNRHGARVVRCSGRAGSDSKQRAGYGLCLPDRVRDEHGLV